MMENTDASFDFKRTQAPFETCNLAPNGAATDLRAQEHASNTDGEAAFPQPATQSAAELTALCVEIVERTAGQACSAPSLLSALLRSPFAAQLALKHAAFWYAATEL